MMITLVILSPVSSWTALTVHCGPAHRERVGDLPLGVGADVVLVGQRVGGVVPGLAGRGLDVQVARDRQDRDVLPVRGQVRDHQDVGLHGRIGGCRPADLGVLRADPGVRAHHQDVLGLIRLRGRVRRNRGPTRRRRPSRSALVAWSVGSLSGRSGDVGVVRDDRRDVVVREHLVGPVLDRPLGPGDEQDERGDRGHGRPTGGPPATVPMGVAVGRAGRRSARSRIRRRGGDGRSGFAAQFAAQRRQDRVAFHLGGGVGFDGRPDRLSVRAVIGLVRPGCPEDAYPDGLVGRLPSRGVRRRNRRDVSGGVRERAE